MQILIDVRCMLGGDMIARSPRLRRPRDYCLATCPIPMDADLGRVPYGPIFTTAAGDCSHAAEATGFFRSNHRSNGGRKPTKLTTHDRN